MVQITLSLHRQRLLLSHTDWDRGTPHGAAPSHTAASGEPNIEHSFTAASRVDVERKSVPTHYDAFHFNVSTCYREILARDLAKVCFAVAGST